jgi:hypothetical protein
VPGLAGPSKARAAKIGSRDDLGYIRPHVLSLYGQVAVETGWRMVKSWPALLALPVYPLIFYAALMLTGSAGIIGSILMSFVIAACWSSYLELISQAVAGARFQLDWKEFKRTFSARFWDVVSVMFVFWLIQLFAQPLTMGRNGAALSAIIGLAIAFFFNAVPELLYQGNSRSFALLTDSARFITEHPVAWLFPNVLLAAVLFWMTGGLAFFHPVAILVAFGNTFSSPMGVIGLLLRFPLWAIPLVLVVAHTAMIFRGVLFRELSAGAGNARLRAFRAGTRD